MYKDKLNDNILFSCCCARVGPTWSPVCDCYNGSGRCGMTCVESSLLDEDLFYSVGLVSNCDFIKVGTVWLTKSSQNLYNNITYMYPHATIWLIGTSDIVILYHLISACRSFFGGFGLVISWCHFRRTCRCL